MGVESGRWGERYVLSSLLTELFGDYDKTLLHHTVFMTEDQAEGKVNFSISVQLLEDICCHHKNPHYSWHLVGSSSRMLQKTDMLSNS